MSNVKCRSCGADVISGGECSECAKTRLKNARTQAKVVVDEFLAGHSCACGEVDIGMLRAEHRNGEERKCSISVMRSVGHKAESIVAELKKCYVICDGCFEKLEKPLVDPDAKKICVECGVEKTVIDNFCISNVRSDGLAQRCKECDAKRRRSKVLQAFAYVREYLETHHCIKCGENDPIVLDFDHLDRETKEYQISQMIGDGIRVERIQKEIDKCVVLCGNCHRKHTIEQMGFYKNLEKDINILSVKEKVRIRGREYVQQYLENKCCENCGIDDRQILELDHIDRSTKKKPVSVLVVDGHSISIIQAEIDKCRILCVNCHRKKTAKELNWYAKYEEIDKK